MATDPEAAPPSRRSRARSVVPVAVGLTILVGLLASSAAWWVQDRSTDDTVAARFEAAIRQTTAGVEARISAVESTALATRALFEASADVTVSEFSGFAASLSAGRSLDDRYPGLTALTFTPSTTGSIGMVAPADDADALVGRQLADGPLRGSLDAAADLGIPVVAVLPGADSLGSARIAVVAAVYDDPRASQSIATARIRRESLSGWVLASVEPDRLLAGLLPGSAAGTRLTVAGADGEVLGEANSGTIGAVARRRAVILNQRGTNLVVTLEVGSQFTTPAERRVPWMVLAAGLLLTAAAAWVVWLTTTQRIRALAMVDEATGALAEANEGLADSNERLRQFSGVVAHDLKSPLTTIHGFVSLVASRLRGQDDEQMTGLLSMALADTARMRQMIDDLLQYAMADRELGEVEAVPVADLVATALGMVAGARRPDDTVEVTTDAVFEAHRPSLEQVFTNVIGNALKFRRGDEPAHVTVAAVPGGCGWIVTVADNGAGIPEGQRARVLEAFERGSTDREGTGLGLAICQRIVAGHGGVMRVEASPSGGTAIVFDLPAAPVSEVRQPGL